MSTEAPRASFPPRPATPPRPSHPPAPDSATTDERDTPGTASGPATTPLGKDAARSSDRPNGHPRFPTLDAASRLSEPTPPGRSEPTAPPPPRASTRFPDTPPTVGREARLESDAASGVGRGARSGTDAASGVGRGTRPESSTASGMGREARPGTDTAPGVGGRGTRRPESFTASGAAREARPGTDAASGVGRGTRPESSTASGAGRGARPESTTAPGTGRATRPGPDTPSTAPAPDVPPRPRHLPPSGFSGRAGHSDTSDGTSSETSGRPFRLSAPGRSDAPAGAVSETTGRPFRLPAPRRTGAPGEHSSETTARLRPVPADPTPDEPAAPFGRPAAQGTTTTRPATPPRPAHQPPAPTAPVTPDPALSWSATRPLVSFGEPEGYDGDARPRPLGRRGASQAAAAAVCLVLGLGLISGAVTGSWLVGDSGAEGSPSSFAAAGSLWHSVPVDQLFPPTVQGRGAGPGGADRTWTRIAVAPDSGCKDAFDPLLRKALAPVGCDRLLRATYTDATESYVTTVGLLFTTADAPGMTALANRFRKERLDRRSDLMPLPYAAKGTPAAGFGAPQRASWTVSVLTEAPVVVYAVSGWADGRTVDDPQPAGDAVEADATTAPAQAGLGNEAQGLADRVERDFRRNVRSASEQPS
ncbi:hypothetical protein GCM10010228_21440 [Streptomyces massasporeus]|nr:hypothetical protein GCM10010228_21440 [Streptomyces massasporeus]